MPLSSRSLISSSTNVRTLAETIRGSSEPNPVTVANALLGLQAGVELLERRLIALTEPYTDSRSAWRIHGSNLLPDTVDAGFDGTIDASQITGLIQASQINQINASQIAGLLQASQIAQVNANQINGTLTADQIGAVNADSITGVIVTAQLADQILNSARLMADAFKQPERVASLPALPNANYPVNSLVLLASDKKIYRNNAGTWGVVNASDVLTGYLTSTDITSVSAGTIIGLITAGQIQSLAATQITGLIQASQIQSVAANQITGTLTAGQIASVNATSISGLVQAAQIQSLATTQLTGTLTSDQIASLAATKITGTISSDQIASLVATKITGSIVAAQIASVNASAVTGTLTASQIASVNAVAIVGTLTAAQIASVNATAIQGTVTASQIASVNATTITGTISGGQIGSLTITANNIANLTILGDKIALSTIQENNLAFTLLQGFQLQPIAYIVDTPDYTPGESVTIIDTTGGGKGGVLLAVAFRVTATGAIGAPNSVDYWDLSWAIDNQPAQSIRFWTRSDGFVAGTRDVASVVQGDGNTADNLVNMYLGIGFKTRLLVQAVYYKASGGISGPSIVASVSWAQKTT